MNEGSGSRVASLCPVPGSARLARPGVPSCSLPLSELCCRVSLTNTAGASIERLLCAEVLRGAVRGRFRQRPGSGWGGECERRVCACVRAPAPRCPAGPTHAQGLWEPGIRLEPQVVGPLLLSQGQLMEELWPTLTTDGAPARPGPFRDPVE